MALGELYEKIVSVTNKTTQEIVDYIEKLNQ